jgi:hypothetical protein
MSFIDRVLSFGKSLKEGYTTSAEMMSQAGDKGHSIFNPTFYRELKEGTPEQSVRRIVTNPNTNKPGPATVTTVAARDPITLTETPVKFLGAYAARLLTDVGNDSTRRFYWRYNHPLAIADKVLENAIGDKAAQAMTPTQRALVNLGAVVPAAASMGIYDIMNPGEQFRPKGYTQEYSALGADDRRESIQPGQELFDRFFLQRQGDPLKYATAKAEIPELTPERYGNYMNFRYQDKGLLGLGLVKATPENLQGVPEARILNVPVSVPTVTAIAGGATALRYAGKAGAKPGMMALAGLAGSTAGAAAGNLVNEVIAMANRPKLPDLHQYQEQYGTTIINDSQQGIG